MENESENVLWSYVLGKGAQNTFTGSAFANVGMCCWFFIFFLFVDISYKINK